MIPLFRTVLHEDLCARLQISLGGLDQATADAALHAVREGSALGTLDLREAVLLKHFLGVFQLLELHECKVEVLEERSIRKEQILSLIWFEQN